MDLHERLVKARKHAGFETATDAAAALGVKYPTYAGHENGASGFRASTGEVYARRFRVRFEWLMRGTGPMTDDGLIEPASEPLPPPNARLIGPVDMIGAGERIPVLGQAVGGIDGRFIFNGETMAEVYAPSSLWGVRNAYAVYVSGDSMEPRYYAGETIFVNPHIPARQGDFVVVQIIEEPEEPPAGYIKQFVSVSGDTLRLRQFNPAKDMHFPRARVVSVHKIVGSGV
jgi:phage repressor protein C with HTH and peptisase S24 domain